MKSILQATRLILAINLIAQSAGIGYASTGKMSLPYKKPLIEGGLKNLAAGERARIQSAYPSLPLYFEANSGQTDPAVKFLARGPGYRLFVTASEAILVLRDGKKDRNVIPLHLKGSNPHPVIEGQGLLPGKSSYFIGNDSKQWVTGVAHYSKVIFRQVYPGIDMVYEGDGPQLEFSFIVAPGADADLIRMDFKGPDQIRLDPRGTLILSFKAGAEAAFKAPTLYQQMGKDRVSVRGRFVLAGKTLVRFDVGEYIRSKELVIDPSLAYSTYLGGTVEDRANAIAVDSSGNAYATGKTASGGFPGSAGMFQSANAGGAFDVFVTKINSSGSGVVWSTYLGGGGVDIGNGIAVDGSGIVHITGSSTAAGAAFPVTAAFQPVNAGGTDAFVTAINAAGTALIYSTLLGGAGEEHGFGIAVNAAGTAYVTGDITSDNTTRTACFAGACGLAAAVFQNNNGGPGGVNDNAFVAKFNAAGVIDYLSYIGGTNPAKGEGIGIDSLGNAYITGQTGDTFPIFPLAVPTAFKTTITGASDAFVVKVDPTGATRLYSTYVGGSGIDDATAIAVGDPNVVYITGFTFSANFPDIGFATVGQTTIGTAPDAYVFKLHMFNGGAHLDGVYSTYLGASTDDRAFAIAVDPQGDAYVTGRTTSGDFPTVNPLPGQGVLGAVGKVFVTEIGPTGATQVFSTYLGGVTDQAGQGIALDTFNNIYVAGWTNSTDFDTAVPIQSANAGSFDAFVLKITAPTPGAGRVPSSSGAGSYIFPSPADGPTADIVYTMAEAGVAEIRVYNEIGDLVTKVTDSKLAGTQTSTFNTARLAPGVYFYILKLNYNSGATDKRKLKKFVVKH